jgi:hypothetical protein
MNMPAVRFQSNVLYANDPLQPSKYPHIRVPKEVSAHAPVFVSAEQMQDLAPERGTSLAGAAGLTTAKFALRFADPTQQWRQVPSGGAPARWQFQGGAVIFEVLITVYVVKGFHDKVVAVILEHEFLHVRDEIDIISRFMPTAAPRDEMVERYLCQRKEVDESMYRNWFAAGTGSNPRGTGDFEKWVRDGVWLPERNKRAKSRDSGPEWESFRNRIDELQRTLH